MDSTENLVDTRAKQHLALQLELLRLKKEEKALRQFYEKLTGILHTAMFRMLTKPLFLLKSCEILQKLLVRMYAVQGTAAELKLTDRCVQRLKEVAEKDEYLRVLVDGGGCAGFEYKIKFDTVVKDDDIVFKRNGVKVLVDQLSLGYMKGATLDYSEDLMRAGFRVINNPIAEKGCSCGSSFAPKMD